MRFNWELYIDLANTLINVAKTQRTLEEAYLRSAMSRAYYGIFCIARNFLIRKGKTIPKIDTHKFIRCEYQKSQNRVEKKIAKNLRRLWKERKDADYEDKANIDVQRARIALDLSKRTLKNLQQIGAI